jgi:hypothetical protein
VTRLIVEKAAHLANLAGTGNHIAWMMGQLGFRRRIGVPKHALTARSPPQKAAPLFCGAHIG